MNEQGTSSINNLDARLAGLTEWSGSESNVWRGALAASRRGLGGRVMGVLRTPVGRALPMVALAALAMVVIAGVLVPSLGRARYSSRAAEAPSSVNAPAFDLDGVMGHRLAVQPERERAFGVDAERRTELRAAVAGAPLTTATFQRGVVGKPESPATGRIADAIPVSLRADRQVVRKATMELKTPDVRATFLKAGMVVNQAVGEFIEASTLTGEGNATSGSLTLRVAADRVSDVLNQLRALGTVASENATGEDVTSAVVDLEARLRNEQRIEAELLELVDKRPDAPLKEVLELREQLGRVRESIEQITAQRERIGRLVSLATVLVLIRADNAPKPMSGIGDYFLERIGGAWQSGLRGLVQSVAWLVNVAVGGLVWWLVVGACLVGIRILIRKGAARRAAEPAPAS